MTRLEVADPQQMKNTAVSIIEEVIATEHSWVKAHLDLDLDTITNILSDGYRQIRADGSVIGKDELLTSYRSGERKWEVAESDDYDVRLYGETALLIGRWRGVGENAGERFDYGARFLAVYVLEEGAWKLAADVSIPLGDVRQGIKMQPSTYINDLCQALLDGLTDALGDKLYAAYLLGAVAFPETTHTGDIDFHVILAGRLSEPEHSALEMLHKKLAQDFPPLGVGMDGHYLLLEDARGTAQPVSQLVPYPIDDAWGLHRAHLRAGRCIVLYGPDPRQIYPAASWSELEADLEEQLQYVEAHLEVYPAYCGLNLCRLMYSFENRQVVISKAAAAKWAWERFPQWRGLIEAARKSYAQQASAQDETLMMSEIEEFYQFAYDHIRKNRRSDHDSL